MASLSSTVLALLLAVIACSAKVIRSAEPKRTDLLMPGVQPDKPETYLCTSMELDNNMDHYLVGFEPHSTAMVAHHMLLYGCTVPGSDERVWNCGEMDGQAAGGPVCGEGGASEIIYAWAKDAPKLDLPEGVGFKVGGSTKKQYLVLQVHYMHAMKEPDSSGITVVSTVERMPRTAATLLMVTGGGIAAHKKEHFETACVIDEDVVMHPFAFRTHTHTHGEVVSGWKVQRNAEGQDKWELIGKKNPQLPQMFYPVANPEMTLEPGEVVAARCTMNNEKGDADVFVGATGKDEMCNFYVMYWVDGDKTLSDNVCLSPGPPNYYWTSEAGLNHVPEKQADSV